MPSAKKTDQLLAALTDNDMVTRREAAKKLGKSGNLAAIGPLCRALHEDKSWFVRRNAAAGLGRIRDVEAVPALLQALQDKSQGVRIEAIYALGEIADIRAIEPLCAKLDAKKDTIRNRAIAALIKIGMPSVGALCKTLDSANAELRKMTAHTLTQMHYYPNHFRQSWPPGTLPNAILAAEQLTPQQRWNGLETVRAARPGFWVPDTIGNVRRFCENAAQKATQEAARQGARSVLEYLTLGRASQSSASQPSTLLRPAQETGTPDGANVLLRPADGKDERTGTNTSFLNPMIGALKRIFRRA